MRVRQGLVLAVAVVLLAGCTDSTAGSAACGICSIVVGASDEIAFAVNLQQSEAKVGQSDPCEVAADVASEMIQTLKAG